MCVDPLTATALLATTAGTVVQAREQNANMKRAVNARNEAHEAEQIRQRQFQEESGNQFDSAVNRFAPGEQQRQMGEVRGQRTEALTSAIPETAAGGAGVSLQGSAPKVVGGEIARAMQSANAASRGNAQRLGALGAYGDGIFNDRMALNRTGQNIGTIGNFSGRSAGLLPFEANVAAANSQKPSSGFGEMLQLAGTAASLGGMMGAGPTWGSLFGGGGPQTLGMGPAAVGKVGSVSAGAQTPYGFGLGLF